MRLLQIQIPGGMSPQKTITSVGLPSHTMALDDISENLVRILVFIHLPGTSVIRVAGDSDQWAIWGHNRAQGQLCDHGSFLLKISVDNFSALEVPPLIEFYSLEGG